MKKPPFKRGPSGHWRDTGDEAVRSAHYDPKQFRSSDPLTFRRRSQPADSGDFLIKVVAAILLVAALLGVNSCVREKQNLRKQMLVAQAQETSRLAAAQAASRQKEQQRQRAIQWRQAVPAERQLYRCVDQNGAVSIQSSSCPATSSVTWGQAVPAETPLQASLRQQQWTRQQAEARLRQEEARFAAATGVGSQSQAYSPASGNWDSNSARCQNAKNERDQAYRLAGNNRGFDMIRAWDDIVYEACKGT